MHVAQPSEGDSNQAVTTDVSSGEQGEQGAQEGTCVKSGESEQMLVTEQPFDGTFEELTLDRFDSLEEEKDNELGAARKLKKLKKLRRNAEEETLLNQETSKEGRRGEPSDEVNDAKSSQQTPNNEPDWESLPTQTIVPEIPDVFSLMCDVFGDSDDDSILRDTRPWSELDDLDDTRILEVKKDLQKAISHQRKNLRQATRVSVKARSSRDDDVLDSISEEENSDRVHIKGVHRKRSGHRKEQPFLDAQNTTSHHRKKKYTEDEIRQKIRHVVNVMVDACEADRLSNIQRKPATQKLQHLNQFKETLLHVGWQEFLLDTNVLSVVRDWLKPLPDRTLPSLAIRETLLRCLLSFSHISKFALRDSGIGRIVMFFSKSDTEPTVKDLADKLIARWTHHASSENEYKTDYDAHRRLTPDQVRIYSQQLSFGRTLQGASDVKGQPRQRVHEQMYAAAPILSSMEYVIQPESTVDPKLVAQRSGLRNSRNKFWKKL
ncbi:uncharacterized protein LOC126304701 [Schistocerca gregaria]|uniref:uncharacterized protein LOC126304701 n=1 Tax=Schistocerca gregaria TaxID=7010 RepID=UPI00211DBA11|nr:uncharacterized protein LOC126304701 [Schistocerca gregaria]